MWCCYSFCCCFCCYYCCSVGRQCSFSQSLKWQLQPLSPLLFCVLMAPDWLTLATIFIWIWGYCNVRNFVVVIDDIYCFCVLLTMLLNSLDVTVRGNESNLAVTHWNVKNVNFGFIWSGIHRIWHRTNFYRIFLDGLTILNFSNNHGENLADYENGAQNRERVFWRFESLHRKVSLIWGGSPLFHIFLKFSN